MRSDEVALQIVNPAAVELVFAKMRTQERFVILSGHETDFLAIGFVCHLQAKFPCDRTNFRFRHPTNRRERTLQLFLPQTKKKIRLIFSRIDSLAQNSAPVVAVGVGMFDDRVMPGCDVIAVQRFGFLPKISEFQFLIAHHARIRSPAGLVFT